MKLSQINLFFHLYLRLGTASSATVIIPVTCYKLCWNKTASTGTSHLSLHFPNQFPNPFLQQENYINHNWSNNKKLSKQTGRKSYSRIISQTQNKNLPENPGRAGRGVIWWKDLKRWSFCQHTSCCCMRGTNLTVPGLLVAPLCLVSEWINIVADWWLECDQLAMLTTAPWQLPES